MRAKAECSCKSSNDACECMTEGSLRSRTEVSQNAKGMNCRWSKVRDRFIAKTWLREDMKVNKVDQRTGCPKRDSEEYEVQQIICQDVCQSELLRERGKVVLTIRVDGQVLNHCASKLPLERDKGNGSLESCREIS